LGTHTVKKIRVQARAGAVDREEFYKDCSRGIGRPILTRWTLDARYSRETLSPYLPRYSWRAWGTWRALRADFAAADPRRYTDRLTA
jgi:hypothetical protein